MASSVAAARTWRSCVRSSVPPHDDGIGAEHGDHTPRLHQSSGSLVVSCRVPGTAAIALSRASRGSRRLHLTSSIPGSQCSRTARQRVLRQDGHGPGLDVAIGQMVAEELDVAFERVTVVMGDTAYTCNQGGASGSTGVSNVRGLTRQSGLCRSPPASGRARRRETRHTDAERASGRRKRRHDRARLRLQRPPMRELIGGELLPPQARMEQGRYGNTIDIRVAAKPKDPAAIQVVGKSYPRNDATWQDHGRPTEFVTDVSASDGMLHARVHSPAAPGLQAHASTRLDCGHSRCACHARKRLHRGRGAEGVADAVRAAETLKVEWEHRAGAVPDHRTSCTSTSARRQS